MIKPLIDYLNYTKVSLDIPKSQDSMFAMVFPQAAKTFGKDAQYSIQLSLEDMNPQVSFEKGQVVISGLKPTIAMFANRAENAFATISFGLDATLDMEMLQYEVTGVIESATVESGSLKIDTTMELGRSAKNLEMLLNSGLKIVKRSVGELINGRDLKSYVPAQYQLALFLMKNVSLKIGEQDHYAKLAFSYSVDP